MVKNLIKMLNQDHGPVNVHAHAEDNGFQLEGL